jgi:hypothetical protein
MGSRGWMDASRDRDVGLMRGRGIAERKIGQFNAEAQRRKGAKEDVNGI